MIPVAIAGAACELPGAHSLDELWANVLAERRAFRSVPPHRLDLSAYAPDVAEPEETIACRVAAFVTGYAFPRERYRIPATTYRQADVAHWLALDVAVRAVVDAERRTGGLDNARTAVVVANTLTGETSRANVMRHRWPYVRRVLVGALRALPDGALDRDAFVAQFEARYKAPFLAADDDTLAGSLANTIAGRICNFFDFGGGGYVVDGACASSLVALANACGLLERGDVDAVVVGAVDVSIDPFELIGFSRLGALASDEMRVFTRDPSGFLPGEGAAFVVLRQAPRGRVLGCIRGIALSSDGAGGITRPELDGQLRALRGAYASAARDPRDVALFEAHGTGTAVGDDVELRALRRLRDERGPASPSYVGSVKSLIGHTKACAGMASFLKALMAARRGIIPPHHLAGAPHPALGDTLRAAPRALPWPPDRPRLAGVSSFGFGGINAHAVLEGVPAPRRAAFARREYRQAHTAQDCELVLVGAADARALAAKVETLAAHIAGMSAAELTDFAIASAAEARDDEHRAAIVVERPWACAAAFAQLARGAGHGALADHRLGIYCGSARGAPRIAFLFPGQAAPVRAGAGAFARRFPSWTSRSRRAPAATERRRPSRNRRSSPHRWRGSICCGAWTSRRTSRSATASASWSRCTGPAHTIATRSSGSRTNAARSWSARARAAGWPRSAPASTRSAACCAAVPSSHARTPPTAASSRAPRTTSRRRSRARGPRESVRLRWGSRRRFTRRRSSPHASHFAACSRRGGSPRRCGR